MKDKYGRKITLLERSPKYVREIIKQVESLDGVKEVRLSRLKNLEKKNRPSRLMLAVKRKKHFIKCKVYHPDGDTYLFEVIPETDRVFRQISEIADRL